MSFTFVSTTNMLIVKDNRVLFLKTSESSENFPGWYILPGGKQEVDETIKQTAIRETFEETGIKVINPKLKVVATHNHFTETGLILFLFFNLMNFPEI